MPHAHDGPPAVEAKGLVKTFGRTQAVDGLDLTVPTGTVYGVLGPNGAGKTTAVRMLATLLRPDGGSAHVLGHDVATAPNGSESASDSPGSTRRWTRTSPPKRTSSCCAG